jgi:hypothetical protein
MIYVIKEVAAMSDKPKVEKERYTSYLPKEMVEQMRELSDKTRIPQAALMEEAVLDLLTKYYGKLK